MEKKIKPTTLEAEAAIELSVPGEPVSDAAPIAVVVAIDGALTDEASGRLPAGTLINNRYKIVNEIAEGGMSIVYKAIDTQDLAADADTLVAMKVLRTELARDPSIVDRLHREARSVKELDHPNIVQVRDYGSTEDGLHFIVMQLIDGPSLADLIVKEKQLSSARSINLFLQLCDALQEAHQHGIVHRDIKPSNILMAIDENGEETAKIADFGIAKPSPSERALNPSLTHTGSILGSPAYMSPEQCMGTATDERTDIYSLGCVMYETLTGRSPFAADTPVKSILSHLEQNPEPFEIEFKGLKIPAHLEKIVLKCLEKEPANRYQKAILLREALSTPPASGIYRRIIASLIDATLVGAMFFLWANNVLSRDSTMEQSTALFYLFFFVVCFYWAVFESSPLQGTLGKALLGLKVYGENGERAKFGWSLVRTLGTFSFPLAIMSFVFWFLGLCFWLPHHTQYEMTIGLNLMLWIGVLNALPLAFNHGRQSVMDKISGRIVAPTWQIASGRFRKRQGDWATSFGRFIVAITTTIIALAIPITAILILFHGPSEVVVARGTLQPGTKIRLDSLYTAHTLPFLNAAGSTSNANSLVGRVVGKSVYSGDPVLEKDLETTSNPLAQ